MTEQSSCRSFFGAYLRYRIKSQRMNLILSCILNLLTLPLFVVGYASGLNDEYSQFYYFGTFFSVLCGLFLIVLAVIGAIFSFEFYNRKNLTDTVGCLPLTYRQRFWGDLLGGYIANVAPSVPFGLAAAIIANAHSGFRLYGLEISKLRFMLGMAVSLFFALTFTYLFAVLVTSACGKVLHSVLFTVFGIAVLCGTVAGLGGCFGVGMLGVDPSEYMDKAASFMQPQASYTDLLSGIGLLGATPLFELLGSGSWSARSDKDLFYSANVSHIVIFVILGAIVTLGAYHIGKRRRIEKTGSAFAVKPVFYVISALACAAGVFNTYVSEVRERSNLGRGLLFAAGVGAVLCVISVVMYLPKKKSLTKCIICGAAAIAVSVGTVALLRGTGSFGAAYLPENAKEIEYIRVNYNYSITDKSDIKQYVKSLNDILHKNRNTLSCADRYVIEYKTTDGKVTTRRYIDRNGNTTQLMEESEKTLSGYGRYFFEVVFSHNIHRSDFRIIEKDLTYDIPEQSREEFLETLSKEAAEKYDPEAEIYARVEFTYVNMSFDIGKNLVDTIALLDRIKDTAEPDPNEIVWKVDYRPENSDNTSIKLNIRNRDMDDPLVKELIGLLKGENSDINIDSNFMAYFKSSGSGTGWDYYYVPQESSKRVLEIMAELVFKEIEAQAV